MRRQINFTAQRLIDKFVFLQINPLTILVNSVYPIPFNLKKLFSLFVILFSTFGFCLAQPVASPNVKCVSVDPTNGDVTLTWITPSGPGGFLNYQIYAAALSAGPYTLAGTVNTYLQTSFTHTGAGANLVEKFYRIQTEYNPGPTLSPPADTFSTVFLTVTNPANGTAILNWNKISIQPISSSTGWYKIYREYPTGVWTLRDSTQMLSYIDIIDICGYVLNYRIEIADNTGCTSVSNVAGGTIFSDITPPTLAPIDTVSVDASTSDATISWNPSPSPDADSIVIYRSSSGNSLGPWIAIDTVAVPATSYTYPASNAGNVSELYRIAFLDSCGNISPLGTFHKTIYLSTSFNICAATADLIWNKYVNWTPGVSQYQIWKSVNGGAFILIGTNPSTDTTFLDNGLVLGTQYCYFIRATNGTKTSSSNRVCFNPNVSQPPTFLYNRFATVTGDNSILIKAHVDIAATSVKYYRIQRATRTSGSFSVIVPGTLPTGSTLTYTDNSVNATTTSYIYKIDAIDSCGNVITSSNPDTTILLSGSISSTLDIKLSWNDYGSFNANVDYYEVYRAVDGVWGNTPIGTVNYSGAGGTYTDDIAPFLSSRGNFTYYVVALEESGNVYGFSDSSTSNLVKIDQFPKFYVPNAFSPNGDNINDIFIPVIGFIEQTNYAFTIFDNTGTPAFESSNVDEGWDGKKNGHPCQEGVYMYLITCKAANGEDSKISGTISLFR